MIFLASVPEAEGDREGEEILSTRDDNAYRIEAEKGEEREDEATREGENTSADEEKGIEEAYSSEQEDEQEDARPAKRRRGKRVTSGRGKSTMASLTGENSGKSINNLEKQMEKQIKSSDKQAGQLKQLQSDIRQIQKQLSSIEKILQRVIKKGTSGRGRK